MNTTERTDTYVIMSSALHTRKLCTSTNFYYRTRHLCVRTIASGVVIASVTLLLYGFVIYDGNDDGYSTTLAPNDTSIATTTIQHTLNITHQTVG